MPMPVMRMDTTTMRITIMATMIIMATTMIMPHMLTVTITITTTSIAITPMITTATSMLMTTNEPVAARDLAEREAAALYRLMTWLSPAFPVGGFSYSSGIEWAGEAGDIADAGTLRDWLAAMLAEGAGLSDGIFLAHAHRAVETGNDAGLHEVVELAAAFVPSRERQLETTAQGRPFIDISRSAWSCAGLEQAIAGAGGAIVYPVAVGLV